MTITRQDIIHDISNLAYVIADVSEGQESPHTLHQTFDICERGNIDRVDRLLALAASEVGAVLPDIASLHFRKGSLHLKFRNARKETRFKIIELAREYMVASVLHGWLAVTLPEAASFWKERRLGVMESLQTTVYMATASLHTTLTRRLSPF